MSIKRGRPFADATEADVTIHRITFCVDAETLEALKQLESEAGPNIRGRRSIVLRRLILEALKGKK